MSLFENKANTSLESIGEFGLIKHLAQSIVLNNDKTIKGIGDDAAVIDDGNKFLLITTDSLIEGIHFDLSYVPLKHLGYKAVAVNLSDIFAMNGTPTHITVALSLSSKYTLEAVEELYSGILTACKNYSIDLVGGDTTSSLSGMMITITATGYVDKNKITYRSGANEHDLICVSGDLGGAYMGLQILEREKKVFSENPQVQPDLSGFDYILERQLKPEPAKRIIKLLHDNGIIPTSMIDISDGLGSELLHLCNASQKGCDIYLSKIPIDHSTRNAAEQFNIDPITVALNGGEDYELLFTVAQKDFEIIKKIKDIHVIGHVTPDAGNARLVNENNQAIPIHAMGWNAFKS